MAGQPKPAFYVAVGVVVLALILIAVYPHVFVPKPPKKDEPAKIDAKELESKVEAPTSAGVTTVKEYSFKSFERLPEVKGISAYKKLTDNTVRFAINVWAGWGPIIFANDGFKANKTWKTPDGQDFKVELVLIDDPIKMRDAYAAGDVHIGWGTLDMVPLFLQTFVDKSGKPTDTRIMPRIYQQVDWSNGGDGIVVREAIKTVADLRGKKLVLAGNSPSHYFALNMLVYGGLQPSEVQMVFTEDAFQAAAAFNAQKDIAGAVSWAPDIYTLAKIRGNRMLVTTAEANKLIADIWFARADFAKDHAGILEGLVRGIFDAMVELKMEEPRKRLAPLMAKGYNVPETDALGMMGDAHSTNWAENYQFFVNQNNPTNFEQVWSRAYYLYRRTGGINHQPVPFDQVMDFSIIQKLGREEKYASQKDEHVSNFVQRGATEIRGAEKEILTNTVQIRFATNNWDLHKKITKEIGGKTVEELYDANVDLVLADIAKLAGQFGGAHIIIEGHTDSSMKGSAPAYLVKELSERRANAVKEALMEKYQNLDAKRFAVEGLGWDRPADPKDPDNQAKNRRVEVKVYTAEKQ
jgi:NitT/TauT family transport system substrate-binding protein